jgi:ABC-2 type transport system permease protein
VTDIQVDVDLYPEQQARRVPRKRMAGEQDRRAHRSYRGDNLARGRGRDPAASQSTFELLSFEGGQTPVIEDAALGFYLYRLPQPLPPHGRIAVDFALDYPNYGFVNSNPNGDIVRNGSFVNGSYLPFRRILPGCTTRRRQCTTWPRSAKIDGTS